MLNAVTITDMARTWSVRTCTKTRILSVQRFRQSDLQTVMVTVLVDSGIDSLGLLQLNNLRKAKRQHLPKGGKHVADASCAGPDIFLLLGKRVHQGNGVENAIPQMTDAFIGHAFCSSCSVSRMAHFQRDFDLNKLIPYLFIATQLFEHLTARISFLSLNM